MKKEYSFRHRQVFIITLNIIFLFLISCNKQNNPEPQSPQDQTTQLLTSGTWKLQSESADGVDQTAMYAGFTISFTKSGFATTNGSAIWPYHGTWSFDGTTTNIKRNDGVMVQISVSESTLVMTLDWQTSTLGTGGRTNSTSGQNIFTMIK